MDDVEQFEAKSARDGAWYGDIVPHPFLFR